ncbi:MAG: helix-turn-helix domain-containing protein [Halodesulfurarchaeum sp.]
MTVIADLVLSPEAFELGRILATGPDTAIELETIVPLGERPVPFVRVFDDHASFEKTVEGHGAINDIQSVSRTDEEALYALDWDVSTDTFFAGLLEVNATVLGGQGLEDRWEFNLRFPSHDGLADFREYCVKRDIPIDITGLFNPTRPEAGPWYGLTPAQRESLVRAVEAGYYSIPRQVSTNELAAEFDVSDQAMTERLRRAIIALVSNTLLLEVERTGAPR